MAEQNAKNLYFIAKVNNFPSLKQAVQSCQWACADRVSPPHPREILTQAFSQGKVYIIFSVSNCHGWHGYAEMLNVPGEVSKRSECTSQTLQKHKHNTTGNCESCKDEAKDLSNITVHVPSLAAQPGKFHYFDIDWKLNFLDFGEVCLSSKMTEELICFENFSNNTISVNKCRNWQEVSAEVGEILCYKMQEMYDDLCKKRNEKRQNAECHAEPFYKETKTLTVQETWMKIVSQVEKNLGKVILACPFGSQRY